MEDRESGNNLFVPLQAACLRKQGPGVCYCTVSDKTPTRQVGVVSVSWGLCCIFVIEMKGSGGGWPHKYATKRSSVLQQLTHFDVREARSRENSVAISFIEDFVVVAFLLMICLTHTSFFFSFFLLCCI